MDDDVDNDVDDDDVDDDDVDDDDVDDDVDVDVGDDVDDVVNVVDDDGVDDDVSGDVDDDDVDGDNMDDVVIGPESTGEWYALKSQERFFERDDKYLPISYANYYDNPNNIFILDQNGDDKKDILIGPYSNGSWGLIQGK